MKNRLYFFPTLLSVAAFMVACPNVYGGTMLEVTQLPDPGNGVNAYSVSAVASPGDLVASIIGLNLTGALQVNENAAGNANSASVDKIGGTFWNPEWTPFDSHLMLNLTSSSLTTSPGFGLAETNDGSNPAQVNLAGPTPFDNFEGKAGLGSLSFTGDAAQITGLAPRSSSMELLQVVVPAGSTAFLDVTFESDSLERNVYSQFAIGGAQVPEPTTLALFGLGMVGLVGLRRRQG